MAGPRPTRAVLVALFVVLSSIGAVVPMAAPTAASPSGFVGIPDHNVHRSDHAVNPASPPNGKIPAQAAGGSNGNGPSGQAGPPAFVHDKIPDHALERVMSSRHASSTSIQFATTNKAHLAMVVTDDEHHEGRTIAVPTETFVETMGEVPGVSYGVHENGTTWRTAVEVEDGYALIEIPSFSTNTVTWSGQFVHEATPADDGHSFNYDVESATDVASASYTINVTGSLNTEWDNETGTHYGNGTAAINPAGNLAPTGPATGSSPELTVTAKKATPSASGDSDKPGDDRLPRTYSNLDTGSSTVTEISITVYDSECQVTNTFDVWINAASGWQQVKDDESTNTDCQTYSYTYSSLSIATGQTVDVKLNDSSDNNVGFESVSAITEVPEYIIVKANGETKDFGTSFTDGETLSKPLNISTSNTSITINSTARVDWELDYEERTQTVDPSVEVNGQWTNHTGTLSDGTTQSLTTNTDWLVDGTNRVNVTIAEDEGLTSDAPAPQVDLYYTHDGDDKTTVEFTAEKWTESYNISKTYAADQVTANLTIPFDSSSVVQIRDVDKQINSGGFTAVDSGNYSLDGTTLTVQFGAVSKNDKVYVRVNGSKVSPNNATITVLEATVTGSAALDSKIRVDSWASDSYIGVGGTEVGAEIHYTTTESWTASEYAVFEGSSTQKIHLPNVGASDTFRVKTLPVEVDTVQGGDVRIEVTSTDSTPAFRVKPGPGGGGSTTVWYKYLDASTGVSYELYSLTNGVVRDTGEASSPVTLEDDDSDEELEVRESTDGGTSSDGSGGGGGGGDGGTTILVGGTGPAANPLFVIGGVVAAILVLFVLGRRFGLGGGGIRGNAPLLLGSGILAVVAVETISPGTVSSIFQFGLTATTGVGAIVIGLALLVLVVTIDARVFKLPTIVRLFAFGSIGLYLANALTNGALEAGLARVSPLLWLLGGVAVVIAVWRSLRGPTFQVIARRQE